jgi:hypothetical protein
VPTISKALAAAPLQADPRAEAVVTMKQKTSHVFGGVVVSSIARMELGKVVLHEI